jgi:uncharacterized protein (TIGR02996 family)
MQTDDDIEADLLRAICTAPDQDAPRLVYADWLMQRGDPRGEFIAAQCLGPIESGARWRALLSEHEEAWAAHVLALPLSYRFERGFIAHVRFETLEGFLEHRAAVVRWMPMPKLSTADDGVGWIVVAPGRAFAAYATAEGEGHGAYGTDRYRVFDLRTAALLADHVHSWTTPAARTARCWFAAGLRTLVIEHVDDRDPIILRF